MLKNSVQSHDSWKMEVEARREGKQKPAQSRKIENSGEVNIVKVLPAGYWEAPSSWQVPQYWGEDSLQYSGLG